jgi:transcription initiation factor IIE alpha subunit
MRGRRPRTAEVALDLILEGVERRRLAPAELRILLALLEREATDAELAQTFGQDSEEIRRLAERLYARGLLRWRHDARSNATVLGITRAGLASLGPLLSAATDATRRANGTP